MRPSRVSAELKKIASRIDSCERPRPDLVSRDLRRVLAGMEGTSYKVWVIDETSDGWDEDTMSSDGMDPEAVKDDLNVQWEKVVNDRYDPEFPTEADLGPVEEVADLSQVVAFSDEESEGLPLPASGPGWVAQGKYGRLDTYLVWQPAT